MGILKSFCRLVVSFDVKDEFFWSELHASPHVHIWIYMDKTIWECALYAG